MVNIDANTDNNYLIVHTAGVVTSEEYKKIRKRLEEILPTLTEGFSIIHDITQLRLYNEDYPVVLKDVHGLIKGFRHGRIIRIIGNSRDTLFKMAQFDQQNNISHAEFVPDIQAAFDVLGILSPEKNQSEKVHTEKEGE